MLPLLSTPQNDSSPGSGSAARAHPYRAAKAADASFAEVRSLDVEFVVLVSALFIVLPYRLHGGPVGSVECVAWLAALFAVREIGAAIRAVRA